MRCALWSFCCCCQFCGRFHYACVSTVRWYVGDTWRIADSGIRNLSYTHICIAWNRVRSIPNGRVFRFFLSFFSSTIHTKFRNHKCGTVAVDIIILGWSCLLICYLRQSRGLKLYPERELICTTPDLRQTIIPFVLKNISIHNVCLQSIKMCITISALRMYSVVYSHTHTHSTSIRMRFVQHICEHALTSENGCCAACSCSRILQSLDGILNCVLLLLCTILYKSLHSVYGREIVHTVTSYFTFSFFKTEFYD